ncbi:MAG: hypothetical protein LBG52_01170 [Candidatus Peribacteria bacterium]|nr:hypothetical protein [Candidatus Peribacteria bacterium]
MLLTLFSLMALAMGCTILYWLFYGIITLVFHPTSSHYQTLIRLSVQLLVALILYTVSVFLINSFLATTQLYYLQFTFSQIAQTVGNWMSFSRF